MSDRQPLTADVIGALVLLVNQERLDEAERRARTLIATDPDAGMLWKILGVVLLRRGKDALPALRRTVELMPDDAEAYANLGSALHDQQQWAPALSNLRRALAIQPNSVEALVEAGNATRALGNARDAIPLYQRALRLRPQLAMAHNNLGNAFLELKLFEDAVRCYRAALEVDVTDAQVQCNLGNALRQLGRLEEAAVSTRRALDLAPTLSMAHNNLGLIFAARGERRDAVSCYRQALELNPRYVDALNNLGSVLRELGERRDALALYARAIESDPQRVESRCNLGNVLFDLRRLDEAVASHRNALTLRPKFVPAHVGLGNALRMQGRPADAETSCRAALLIEPDNADALRLLGELYADRGCFSEAAGALQRATAADPTSPSVLASIAAHRKMTDNDGAWRHSVETLIGQRLPLDQEISLRYALGKYFDDLGDYPRAFERYREANELTKRHAAPFDPAALSRRVDRLIDGFDAVKIAELSQHGNRSDVPVLVIGMPRSGTSLTEQILASHPVVFGAGEVLFWDGAPANSEAPQFGEKILPIVAAQYLDRLKFAAGGARRIIDKMPANFMYVGLIHAALPKARIIHVRRNPIDTCLSIYFQNFFRMGPYANDLENLTHYYRQYLRITDHWRAVLPAAAFLDVTYESLIEDQESCTRRMLEFIDIPWDSRCLDFHRTERVVLTASKWQVRQKVYSGSVGRWRNYEKYLGPLRQLMDSTTSAA